MYLNMYLHLYMPMCVTTYPQARYVLGAAGQNGCPSGYQNILAASACQAAAQALGLGDRTMIIVTSVGYETNPKGCFKWLSNGFVYLNPNTGVPANPTSEGAPICEAFLYAVASKRHHGLDCGAWNLDPRWWILHLICCV